MLFALRFGLESKGFFMSKVAFIFPGQGAQYVGMGKDFYEAFAESRAVIDQAHEILGNGLRDVMFNGPEEKLKETAFAQPAIFAMSIAALEALRIKYPDLKPVFTAGLSLGEYPALTASGALSLENTIRLIQRRGAFMQEAAVAKRGAMAAVIGMDPETIRAVCDENGAEVANFNAPDQTVITGESSAVEAACARLTEAGAKRVIPLAVAGAFHSSLMQPAADQFQNVLAGVEFTRPVVPLIGNVHACPCSAPDEIRTELAEQIVSSVQWVKTVEFMVSQGVNTFIEIGPGRILKGLIRKINRELTVKNVEKAADLECVLN